MVCNFNYLPSNLLTNLGGERPCQPCINRGLKENCQGGVVSRRKAKPQKGYDALDKRSECGGVASAKERGEKLSFA